MKEPRRKKRIPAEVVLESESRAEVKQKAEARRREIMEYRKLVKDRELYEEHLTGFEFQKCPLEEAISLISRKLWGCQDDFDLPSQYDFEWKNNSSGAQGSYLGCKKRLISSSVVSKLPYYLCHAEFLEFQRVFE